MSTPAEAATTILTATAKNAAFDCTTRCAELALVVAAPAEAAVLAAAAVVDAAVDVADCKDEGMRDIDCVEVSY
jgi:hypothetical protein